MLMKMLTDQTIPFNLVLTKADKMKGKKLERRLKEITDTVLAKGNAGTLNPIVHMTSAHASYGLGELMSDMVFILD